MSLLRVFSLLKKFFFFQNLFEYYFKICSLLPKLLRPHIHKERIFSVEKESEENINDLKRCIASTLTSLDHWGVHVPIAWNKLEYVLRTASENFNIYSFSDLQKDAAIADDIFMKSKEELITALEFFNDTGLILFRNEIGNKNENVVILNVQWFVNAFKCIIMDDIHLEKMTNENFKDFGNLYRNGLLSIELLKALWDHSDFYLHQNNLVKHMKHLDMLAELEPGSWYVPCINKQKYTETVLKNCTISHTLCFVFDFLPIDVYHRLINACINKLKMTLWKRNEYCIYHSVTMLKCKNTKHRLVIGIRYEERDDEYPYSIEIQAIETHPRNPESQWCSEIKENIYRILSDLTFISRGMSFEVGYLCSKLPHTNRPQGHIILEKELEKGVDCFKCSSVHAGDGELILGFWEVCIFKP